MKCTNCNSDVVAEAAFCNHCGTALQARCAGCQAINPLESSFCHSCGRSLDVGVPTEEAAPRRYEPVTGTPAPSVQKTCPRCNASNEAGSIYCYDCGLPLDDSTATTSPVSPSRVVSEAGRPAGFWIRLVAWLIDSLILMVVVGVIAATTGFGRDSGDIFQRLFIERLLIPSDFSSLLLSVVYITIGVTVWSTTGGKRILGLYVYRPDGSRVGARRAFVRNFAHILSGLILFVGHIMIGVRGDKRGLHDLICDTVVVKR